MDDVKECIDRRVDIFLYILTNVHATLVLSFGFASQLLFGYFTNVTLF